MAGARLDGATDRVHATTIAVAGRAALIRGPSGAGKSDLALRCLAATPSPLFPQPAQLVADDQTLLTRRASRIMVSAPASIRGQFEIRGLGIVTLPALDEAQLALIVELTQSADMPRFPDPWPMAAVLGLKAPVLRIDPWQSSAAAKVLAALALSALPPISGDDHHAT